MGIEHKLQLIHETIVNAFEEDLHRKHIGRFCVIDLKGSFQVRHDPDDFRTKEYAVLNEIEYYHLQLETKEKTSADYNDSLQASTTITYNKTIENKENEQRLALVLDCSDLDLDFVYDQLMCYRNPDIEEKATQLSKLLTYGDKIEGTFHYAELGGREKEEAPELTIPCQGRWVIEKMKGSYRGYLFMLTGPEITGKTTRGTTAADEYMLMINYSHINKLFECHEFREPREQQIRIFDAKENRNILEKALDAIARRIRYDWR